MIKMCEFCETTKEEVERFHEWADANPYKGDAQVNDGLDYVLDGNTFSVVAMFDGGYLHDKLMLKFNYCPMCGRKLYNDRLTLAKPVRGFPLSPRMGFSFILKLVSTNLILSR